MWSNTCAAGGFNLGGEQSGHIVMSDLGTTGDGLAAALQVLAALVQGEQPASRLLRAFRPLPQVLRNVRVPGGGDPAAILTREPVRPPSTPARAASTVRAGC